MNFLTFDLNKSQVGKMSDIASDIALVSLASVFLPAVFEKFNMIYLVAGSVITIGFWIASIWFRKEL